LPPMLNCDFKKGAILSMSGRISTAGRKRTTLLGTKTALNAFTISFVSRFFRSPAITTSYDGPRAKSNATRSCVYAGGNLTTWAENIFPMAADILSNSVFPVIRARRRRLSMETELPEGTAPSCASFWRTNSSSPSSGVK